MTTYGLTATGFAVKTLVDSKAELDAAYKAGPLGASAGTNPDGSIPAASLAGQMIAIDADRDAGHWDQMQQLYRSFDPAGAVDDALDNLCALTATIRDKSTQSQVTAIMTGDPGTVIPVGAVATVIPSGTRFDLDTAPATLINCAVWQGGHTYSVGDLITNDTPSRVYYAVIGGITATTLGGPTGVGSDITDGAVHWCFIGNGTAAATGVFVAEDVGPLAALAWYLQQIATPISGWNGVVNPLDATVGQSREVEAHLRAKRESELAGTGGGTAPGIESVILRVGAGQTDPTKKVTSCRVFTNSTDTTDSNGLPPRSVMVLVVGCDGHDDLVAQAVWNAVGGGIATFGTTGPITVTDSNGNPQIVYFSRPTPVPIYVAVELKYDAFKFPSPTSAGVDAIRQAVAYYGADFPIGESVRAQPVGAAVDRGPAGAQDDGTPYPPVPGILEVTEVYIGLAAHPGTSTTIPILATEQATFDSGHVDVTITPDTP